MRMRKVVEREKIDFIRFNVDTEATMEQLFKALAISKNVRAVESEKIAIGQDAYLYGPDAKSLHAFVDFVRMA